MVDPRQKHAGKTKAEKRTYIQNILQPTEGTAEIPLKKLPQSHGDTTDEKMSEEEQELYKRTRKPPLPPEPKSFFLYKFLIPLIITAAVAFFGWQAKMIVDLNREIGEIKTELKHVKDTKESDSKRLDRLEDLLNRLGIKLIEKKTRK
jgi:hypothetical protein